MACLPLFADFVLPAENIWPTLQQVDEWRNAKGYPDCLDCPGPISQETAQQLKYIIINKLPFKFTELKKYEQEQTVYYKAERDGVILYLAVPKHPDDTTLAESYTELRWYHVDPFTLG